MCPAAAAAQQPQLRAQLAPRHSLLTGCNCTVTSRSISAVACPAAFFLNKSRDTKRVPALQDHYPALGLLRLLSQHHAAPPDGTQPVEQTTHSPVRASWHSDPQHPFSSLQHCADIPGLRERSASFVSATKPIHFTACRWQRRCMVKATTHEAGCRHLFSPHGRTSTEFLASRLPAHRVSNLQQMVSRRSTSPDVPASQGS